MWPLLSVCYPLVFDHWPGTTMRVNFANLAPRRSHFTSLEDDFDDDGDEDGEDDCDDEENNIAGLHIRGPSGDRQHPSPSHVFAPSLESYAKMMMCHDLQS